MRQPDDIVQVLYGSETLYKNCPAYCLNHHKFLTEKQIKNKGCLGKQCQWLDKREHQFWKNREEKKRLKLLKAN